MLKLKKIAITGDIATGKSTVCRYFKELGAYVIDSDAIVHKLFLSKTSLGKQIIQLLGSDIVVNKQINRKKVANKVFNAPEKLKALEKLLHPYVFSEIEKIYKKVTKEKLYSLFVVEMPLLFETHSEKNFDIVITVISNESLCKKRWGKDIKDYEQRKKRLIPQNKKIKKSDFIIINNNTFKELKKNVREVFTYITSDL